MANYRVGYATGVFDMFHIGHLNILCSAKSICDRLIVGVDVDELVIRSKGKKPVIPFEERIKIVEAIEFVDEVVAQVHQDKVEAWHRLKFDVLISGDDKLKNARWDGYRKQLAPLGVDIILFPYTVTTSSTMLREKLILY